MAPSAASWSISSGHTEMVEPLLCDLLAGAISYRLFDIVPGPVGKERIEPHNGLIRRLLFEVWLSATNPFGSFVQTVWSMAHFYLSIRSRIGPKRYATKKPQGPNEG